MIPGTLVNVLVHRRKILQGPQVGTNGGLEGSCFLGWKNPWYLSQACNVKRGALVQTPGPQFLFGW